MKLRLALFSLAFLGAILGTAHAQSTGLKVLYACNSEGPVRQNMNDSIQIAEDAQGNIQVTAVYGPYRTPDTQLSSLSAMLGVANATIFDFQAGSCVSLAPLYCGATSSSGLTLQASQQFNLPSSNPAIPDYDVLTVTATNSTQKASAVYACYHWVVSEN
jgi:hypothetical protein